MKLAEPRKGLPNDKQVLHLRMAEVRLTDKNILISHRDQSFIGLCKKGCFQSSIRKINFASGNIF
jgi:hypothetical protein